MSSPNLYMGQVISNVFKSLMQGLIPVYGNVQH